MKRLSVLLALAALSACKKDVPAAPVANGSYLVYEVTEGLPDGPKIHDLKISFTQQGDLYQLDFSQSAKSFMSDPPAALKVDASLVPEDNIITAYNIGRLWLPPEGRANGKMTPCGTVGTQRHYKKWDVFPVEGMCGRAGGTRYYDVNTGMLVAFMFSGGVDVSAQLKDAK